MEDELVMIEEEKPKRKFLKKEQPKRRSNLNKTLTEKSYKMEQKAVVERRNMNGNPQIKNQKQINQKSCKTLSHK